MTKDQYIEELEAVIYDLFGGLYIANVEIVSREAGLSSGRRKEISKIIKEVIETYAKKHN